MKIRVLVAAVCLLTAANVSARIQGAKGRRLEVYTSLAPYQDAVLVLRAASVETTALDDGRVRRRSRPVDAAMIGRYTDQFLATRLREVPGLRLSLSYPTELTADVAVMVASVRVIHQSKGWARAGKVLVGIDLYDGRTGELLANFTGYGHGGVRRELNARRDDLQEISRVFVEQFANALQVKLPYRRTFRPSPYLKRPVTLQPTPEMRRSEDRPEPLPRERR